MRGRNAKVFVDLGQRFGRLVVTDMTRNNGRRAAVCICDCGVEEKIVNLTALTSGAVTSCGCLRRELARTRATERNKSAPPRLGKGKSPIGATKYRIDEEGRQCAGTYCSNQYKPWAEFNKGNAANGYNSWCRDCSKSHYNTKQVTESHREDLKRKIESFNITMVQYGLLEDKYDGRCWVCKDPDTVFEETGRDLSIDHDPSHCPIDRSCGKCIRGLLCLKCQSVAGRVGSKDINTIFAYLNQPAIDFEQLEKESDSGDDSLTLF